MLSTPTSTLPKLDAEFITEPFGLQEPNSIEKAMHRLALVTEFRSLQSIVDNTIKFSVRGRFEAYWNEKVHGPMLDLAVLHASNVAVENITRANIAGQFLPPIATAYEAYFKGKMID
jgi:hypothetical protein